MSDLEITRACAEAMGIPVGDVPNVYDHLTFYDPCTLKYKEYGPLHDDAQAMALVKMFPQECAQVVADWADDWITDSSADLNRTICLCIAQMQRAGK